MKAWPHFSILILFVFVTWGCQNSNQSENQYAEKQKSMKESPSKLLRHVVLFKFKEDASPDQIDEVVQAFAGLESKISEIHDFEMGTNNSPEGLNHGYEHAFMVTFLSDADRAVYLDHPDHLAFVDVLLPILEEPTVIDYWTN